MNETSEMYGQNWHYKCKRIIFVDNKLSWIAIEWWCESDLWTGNLECCVEWALFFFLRKEKEKEQMVQTKRERERKNTKKIHMKEMKKVRLGMSNGTKTVDDYEDEDFYVRFWKIYWHIINHEWQCIEWQFTEFLKHIGAIFNEQHWLAYWLAWINYEN